MPDSTLAPSEDTVCLKSPRTTDDPDFWIRTRHCASDGCIGYKIDTYGGVIFDTTSLPSDPETFRKILSQSMQSLIEQGIRRGYWLRIRTENIEFVPVCIKELGFYIHHATKDYVMLVKWTDDSRPNPIPNQPMHQVSNVYVSF